MKKLITNTLLSLALLSTSSVYADESSGWEHSVSIYGWLPSFNGTLKYTIPSDGAEPEEDAESNAIENLDMVFMGAYEVRKEQWSFLADVIYLKMSADQGKTISILPRLGGPSFEVGAEEELKAWLLGFYGGYNIIDRDNFTMDAIAGMRYFYLGVDTTLSLPNRTVSLSPSVEAYDAIVGIKGRVDIDSNWYIPYLFDIGTGDTDLTWQAETSLGYRFDWGDILLTYRYIHYDKDDSGLVNDFDLYGPKVGVVLHF